MADDAAALLRALEIPSAHVVGFSMGSAIAQELALRHPELVRSLVLVSTYARPDALWRSQLDFWRWLAEVAPGERAFLEAFFTWVYTPRAHADGTVSQLIEEALAFPHKQSVEAFQAQVDVCLTHDTAGRLPEIGAPTLVLSGELPTSSCRLASVGRWPHEFRRHASRSWLGEAHQPFQEVGGVRRPRRGLLARCRGAGLRDSRRAARGRQQPVEKSTPGSLRLQIGLEQRQYLESNLG